MNQKTKKIVTTAMLITLQVIFGRFLSISLPTVKIGFSFLPLVIIAILYGPIWCGAAAAIGDVLVALLGSFGYYPPMTIAAILTGIIYGVFFYHKEANIWRVSIAVICESVLISIILKTYLLSLLMGDNFWVLIPERIFQNLVTCPIQIICIRFLAYRISNMVVHGAYNKGGRV